MNANNWINNEAVEPKSGAWIDVTCPPTGEGELHAQTQGSINQSTMAALKKTR
jgi:hypothetical protein